MDFHIFLVFFVTTAIIIFSPGPTAILMASIGSANGVLRASFGLAGISSATILSFILSATGIASLLVASQGVFQIVKWAGVLYLVYLGLSAIFSKTGGLTFQPGAKQQKRARLFAKGFLIEISNPKALLYYSAILPQFLDLSRPIIFQFIIMGAAAVGLQALIYLAYAALGDRLVRGGIKQWLVSSINKTAGGALLFAAFKMSSVSATQ